MNDLVAQPLRITKRQFAYATMRGRMPSTCADWRCKCMADGLTDEEIDRFTQREINAATATARNWNLIPAVQAQIDYERSVAIETRLKEPIRAWEAKLERLLAIAAGELPQVRTVDTGKRKRKIVDEDVEIESRVLDVEEYHESNLQALAKVLEMQGRSLGIFKDRAEISGPGGTPLPVIQVSFVHPQGQGDD